VQVAKQLHHRQRGLLGGPRYKPGGGLSIGGANSPHEWTERGDTAPMVARIEIADAAVRSLRRELVTRGRHRRRFTSLDFLITFWLVSRHTLNRHIFVHGHRIRGGYLLPNPWFCA
jgi:hypothetical protein